MFRYWLQGGRFTVGFLGGAQIDRFANLNTTVVGPYHKPKTRLPGGGGAPEISSACGEIFITWPGPRPSSTSCPSSRHGHGSGPEGIATAGRPGSHRSCLGDRTGDARADGDGAYPGVTPKAGRRNRRAL
jgi:hypothetical protein